VDGVEMKGSSRATAVLPGVLLVMALLAFGVLQPV